MASALKRSVYRFIFSRAARTARKIICVSHFTKKELLELEGVHLEEKAVVIPEAASSVFAPRNTAASAPVLEKFAITSPYFLYVGNAKEHKNLKLLFEAFATLSEESPSLVLISSGKEAERLQLPPRVVRIPTVTDDELASLYSQAVALVTPSLSEGFGLPVVEAQACGCPVIAVNAGSIPEVASREAILIEPDVRSLSKALTEIQHRPRPKPTSFRAWDDVANDVSKVLASSLVHIHG